MIRVSRRNRTNLDDYNETIQCFRNAQIEFQVQRRVICEYGRIHLKRRFLRGLSSKCLNIPSTCVDTKPRTFPWHDTIKSWWATFLSGVQIPERETLGSDISIGLVSACTSKWINCATVISIPVDLVKSYNYDEWIQYDRAKRMLRLDFQLINDTAKVCSSYSDTKIILPRLYVKCLILQLSWKECLYK